MQARRPRLRWLAGLRNPNAKPYVIDVDLQLFDMPSDSALTDDQDRIAATSRPRGLIGNFSEAHGGAAMTVIRVARLDRRGAEAAGIVPPAPTRAGRCRRRLKRHSPRNQLTAHEPVLARRSGATAADHSEPAVRGCPALRVTAGHHHADPFPGRHIRGNPSATLPAAPI